MKNQSVFYKEQGDYDKAKTLLIQALEGRRLKLGDTHPHTVESLNNLIDLYEAWDKPEKAEEWRSKLLQKPILSDKIELIGCLTAAGFPT